MRDTAFTSLQVGRNQAGEPQRLLCTYGTARDLGWLSAFPESWAPEAQLPGEGIRRPYGTAVIVPSMGGHPSGVWLEDDPCPSGNRKRRRFRITGPWTRSALETLRAATVPEVYAIRAGRLRWTRPRP